MRRRGHRAEAEGGAVLVIYALCLVAMFGMAALALDLAQLRVDRRVNKKAADVAARAGVGRLPLTPWYGVCTARNYLLANTREFSALDPASERWTDAANPPTTYGTSPCTQTGSSPFVNPCVASSPATWARLQATALGGRVTVEIQSGYAIPDARFAEDQASGADAGDPTQGSCDNLAVIVTERRSPLFARVIGGEATTTRVRSVARLNSTTSVDYTAALLLLEQHKCGVLQTGGSTTRVYAQPMGSQPGIIQIDSAADSGSCAQPILNGQATSGGPSIVACSASSTVAGCNRGTGTRSSRVGIYALNYPHPPSDIATSYPATYGDTAAAASPRSTRKPADKRYRQNVAALDASAKSILTGNSGMPPGCASVVSNGCTANGRTWLVLEPADCDSLAGFFQVPGRLAAQNVWFHCDLNVTTPLTLSALNSFVVVTGQLTVGNAFTIADPRAFYIGGRSGGNKIGLDVGGAGSGLGLNLGPESTCAARVGPGHTTTVVVGNGSLNVGSGASVHLCQTFVYLASGFDKVPTTDGTPPCASPCGAYLGTVNISSGSSADWSAPNAITGRQANQLELATTNPYEDLALWTEAGGNGNGLTGGATTSLAGVFFLGNADSFNLAGNGTLPVNLSAQFVATSMKVTGGAVVYLVPNPQDSIPVIVYSTLLVR